MSEFYEPAFLIERPSGQRFWVVRASGGQYVRHFRQAGLMAIGHLDKLNLPDGDLQDASSIAFETSLKKINSERSKASVVSHAKQAEAFCLTIKTDDIIVTLDSSALTVGRVTGPAYIHAEPVIAKGFNDAEDKMTHHLRRPVAWGPLIARKQVPVAMEMTLFAHQTVFNIDRYWTSVYHLLYPCFTFEGRLYLSANIQQQEDLDNYAISQLFGLLSGVEVMAKVFAAGSDEWEAYPQNLPTLRESLELGLSSKAEFMSPGTIWSTLLIESSSLVWAAVIYVMIFGGDMKFFKADGLIDIHTRQKLWALVMKLLETHDVKRLRKTLKVDIPRIETSALEVPEQTRKRERKTAVAIEVKGQGQDTQPPTD